MVPRLGSDAALGLGNTAHGPSAHYGRRAHPTEHPHDHLASGRAAHEFLGTHAIPVPPGPPTARQLDRLRAIRAMIRALADDADPDLTGWRAGLEAALVEVRFRLHADGTLRSATPGWDGIVDELLPAALALASERVRIRRCGNPRCGWLFVDRSRKGNRIWCEAAVCGNRMRVGRHRMRRLAGAERPAGQPPR